MPGYDEFQQAVQAKLGRTLTQAELNDSSPQGLLYNLPNEIFTLLPVGHQQMFDSTRLMSLDNRDLYTLVLHNPNIVNQMPAYRFTGGGGYGGFSGDQLQNLLRTATGRGIGGPGLGEIQTAVSTLRGEAPPATAPPGTPGGGGQKPGGGATTAPVPDAQLTLEREKFYADLANQPGNFYNYAFRSRGMDPTGGAASGAPNATGGPTGTVGPAWKPGDPTGPHGGTGPAASSVATALPDLSGGKTGGAFNTQSTGQNFSTQGATANPFYTGPIGATQNPYGPGPFEERPDFNALRGQVQKQGMDIPPGVLNPIIGKEIPTYQSQGGMPFFAPQTLAKMTRSERQLLATTINRTGGRAEDFFERSQQLGQFASRAPTIGYSGSYRGR